MTNGVKSRLFSWQTKSFTGVLTPFTLFLHRHHPANTSCGSLTGNGTLPHSNIVVSVCPQIKTQSLSRTNLRPMDSEWEVGGVHKAPCVSVYTISESWSAALTISPSAPPW